MSQRVNVPPSSDRLHRVLSVGMQASNLQNADGTSSVQKALDTFWDPRSDQKINRFNVEVYIGPVAKLNQMGSREQDRKLWDQYKRDTRVQEAFRGTADDRTVMVLTVWGIDPKTRLSKTALHQNLVEWVESAVMFDFPYKGNTNGCSLTAGIPAGVLNLTEKYSPLLEPCNWMATRASTMIYDYGYTAADGTFTDNFLAAFFDASAKTFAPDPAKCPEPGPDSILEPGTGIYMNRRISLANFFQNRIGETTGKKRVIELGYETTTSDAKGNLQKQPVQIQRTIAKVTPLMQVAQDSERLSFSFELEDEAPLQLAAPGQAGPSGLPPAPAPVPAPAPAAPLPGVSQPPLAPGDVEEQAALEAAELASKKTS